MLTESYLSDKKKQYPSQVGGKESIIRKWLGKRVFDCIGLAKGYLWIDDAGKLGYNSAQDKSVNGMYEREGTKMDNKYITAKFTISGALAGISSYFGGYEWLYLIFATCLVIDWITGTLLNCESLHF